MGVSSRWRAVAMAMALGVLGFGSSAAAQTSNATLQGVVSDTSGAVLPGVTVKLESPSTGIIELERDWTARIPPRFSLGGQCPVPGAMCRAAACGDGMLAGLDIGDLELQRMGSSGGPRGRGRVYVYRGLAARPAFVQEADSTGVAAKKGDSSRVPRMDKSSTLASERRAVDPGAKPCASVGSAGSGGG